MSKKGARLFYMTGSKKDKAKTRGCSCKEPPSFTTKLAVPVPVRGNVGPPGQGNVYKVKLDRSTWETRTPFVFTSYLSSIYDCSLPLNETEEEHILATGKFNYIFKTLGASCEE
ncbi:hypothetical protein SNE40_014554 [Patella caerulea]|uniref:Uncharacterized protein n=1 Tax=Patella caerulea TaxID=87958 RepID=A0AAN8PJA6_PATCE